MLQYIEYENEKKQRVRISDGIESMFAFYDIEGVSAPEANINTKATAGYDGSAVINTSANNRNIILTMQIIGDAEAAKQELYKVFKPKKQGTLYYKADGWDVKIPCYTEKLEILPTARPMRPVVSLMCPQPYWEALNPAETKLQSLTDGLYFPLVLYEEGIALGIINPQYSVNVVNNGTVPLGMTVEFKAISDVSHPKIINTQTYEHITLDVDMQAGDMITVCTVERQKRITLLRDGKQYNYFNYFTDGSTFLRLQEGDNEFQYSAEAGEANLFITIKYTPLYAGV